MCTHDGILSSLEKEGYPAARDHMDEPGGRYAEGNKLITERQILNACTFVKYLE